MSRRHVVVCGGGLAGIAAACEASGMGARVTLVERRPFLGGKAFSFTDAESGREVDNGQHVFLGCCSAYMRLLALLGTLDRTTLQRRLDVPVRDRAGRVGHLRAAPLPVPVHLALSFAAYPHLSARQKAAALSVLARIRLMRPRDMAAIDDVSFADWLAAHGQDEEAVARFWDLIVLPTCNDRSALVSAGLASFVFREGLLTTTGGSAIGWSRVGLTRLVDPAARRLIERRGGRVVTGQAVVEAAETGVRLSDGSWIAANGVVLALPPSRVRDVASDALARDPGLGSSPIVNVHLWYDRPVMDELFTAVLDGPTQWVFNRTAMGHPSADRATHLAVSISGARVEIELGRADLARLVTDELALLFPRARAAQVLGTAVVKEPRATFAAAPGQAALRPGPRTPLPGVAIAGAWTDTGWPATMEGAVRSGIRAARVVAGSDNALHDGSERANWGRG